MFYVFILPVWEKKEANSCGTENIEFILFQETYLFVYFWEIIIIIRLQW